MNGIKKDNGKNGTNTPSKEQIEKTGRDQRRLMWIGAIVGGLSIGAMGVGAAVWYKYKSKPKPETIIKKEGPEKMKHQCGDGYCVGSEADRLSTDYCDKDCNPAKMAFKVNFVNESGVDSTVIHHPLCGEYSGEERYSIAWEKNEGTYRPRVIWDDKAGKYRLKVDRVIYSEVMPGTKVPVPLIWVPEEKRKERDIFVARVGGQSIAFQMVKLEKGKLESIEYPLGRKLHIIQVCEGDIKAHNTCNPVRNAAIRCINKKRRELCKDRKQGEDTVRIPFRVMKDGSVVRKGVAGIGRGSTILKLGWKDGTFLKLGKDGAVIKVRKGSVSTHQQKGGGNETICSVKNRTGGECSGTAELSCRDIPRCKEPPVSKVAACLKKLEKKMCRRRKGLVTYSFKIRHNGKVEGHKAFSKCSIGKTRYGWCTRTGTVTFKCSDNGCKKVSLATVKSRIRNLKDRLCKGRSGSATFSFAVKSNGNVTGHSAFSAVSLGTSTQPWCPTSGSVTLKCGPSCDSVPVATVKKCVETQKTALCKGKTGTNTFSISVSRSGKVTVNGRSLSACKMTPSSGREWCPKSTSVTVKCAGGPTLPYCWELSTKVDRGAKGLAWRKIKRKKQQLDRKCRVPHKVYIRVSHTGSVSLTKVPSCYSGLVGKGKVGTLRTTVGNNGCKTNLTVKSLKGR